ncbi:hypothetical protein Tco_0010202 [Tanacetum coccineum]
MAALKYRDEHNKVGFLEKPKGSADYHQVLDFLRGSHIRYAITHDPIIYDSLVKQFWSTASLRASKEGPLAILATIDRTPYTITESLVRSQLQLDDEGGVEDLPIADIYLGMDNLGYPTEGKLTFHKNKFSPQWRFLVHTILHCLSTKSGSWDQFGSQVAIALICLTEGRRYNWSSYIFKGMVNNINNPKKFLMFPRGPHATFGYNASPAQAAIAVHEQGPSSDPNIASSSRPHESAPDLFTSTNVEDETMGDSFNTSPSRSTPAPPEAIVSSPLRPPLPPSTSRSAPARKVNTQESRILTPAPSTPTSPALLFIGEDAEQDVDPFIKLAKAAATAAAASAVPTGGSHEANIPPSSSIPSDEFAGGSDVPAGATIGPSADPSNKGKSRTYC